MMDSQSELKATISLPFIGVTIINVADIKLYEVEISIHVSADNQSLYYSTSGDGSGRVPKYTSELALIATT